MNEADHGWTRRAILGGIGAGAGLGLAGLGGSAAHAALPASPAGMMARRADGAGVALAASALKPALRYVVLSGYDFIPLDSEATYDTVGGRFVFTGASSGYASVRTNLPVGAVIKELELYGTRGAAGAVRVDLWKSTVATGDVNQTGQAVVPAVAGPFTVTLAVDDTQDTAFKSTPFVNINAAAVPATQIYGMRVGYVSPTGFIPLPSSVPPRVYDTRNPGFTKLAANEERTITLPVPAAIGAAVMTVTLTNTQGGGGYVAVFAAGISWPGNSSVNFSGPNQDIASTVVSAVSSDSKIIIRGGANPTDVIIDVAGWIA